jgi:hypothetical protein
MVPVTICLRTFGHLAWLKCNLSVWAGLGANSSSSSSSNNERIEEDVITKAITCFKCGLLRDGGRKSDFTNAMAPADNEKSLFAHMKGTLPFFL